MNTLICRANSFTVYYGGREQLQKTHANRKSTSKSRKHLHQFDSRCCKCLQHNQINNFIAACFFVWCCKHLQCVCCQIDEVVFLICRCFFYLQPLCYSCLYVPRAANEPEVLHIHRKWLTSKLKNKVDKRIKYCTCFPHSLVSLKC